MGLFYKHPVATVVVALLTGGLDILLLQIGVPWWACWLVALPIGAAFGHWAARCDRRHRRTEGGE